MLRMLCSKKCTDIEVKFKSDKLDKDTIKNYGSRILYGESHLQKELVRMNYAVIKDDMLIMLDDGELCGYIGEKENVEITIPDEVKYISDNAFNSLPSGTSQSFSIKSVILNDTVDTLPVRVFCRKQRDKSIYKEISGNRKRSFFKV